MKCPKCGNKLKVEHYQVTHPSGAVLLSSRLVCSAPLMTHFAKCDYKKEWPMPKELFTETNKKYIEQELDRKEANYG